MNTIKQAREVAKRLSIGATIARERRIDHDFAVLADHASSAIDALIAELEKEQAALRLEQASALAWKSGWEKSEAELERVTTLARGQHVELYNARLELERLKSQEPVDAVLLEDMVEGSHPQYGRGLFTTDNCVKGVYLSAGAQPKQAQCWCTTCRPIAVADMRFVVCPDCGNKRCPKAHNHTNSCTGSNEPGQVGSSWEHVAPVQAVVKDSLTTQEPTPLEVRLVDTLLGQAQVHTDHPMRHYDRTCPACNVQERKPCTCYDDVSRKYCTKKGTCTRIEAHGIGDQP